MVLTVSTWLTAPALLCALTRLFSRPVVITESGAAPPAAVGIPLLFIGSSISVIFYGNWLILPVVFGLNCAALLIGMAVSTVASALTPYPSTRPGESPFLQPQFTESGALSAQLVSFLCGIFLAIPVIVFSISAILHENETAALSG